MTPEPLYYNIQVSVDKDVNFFPGEIYKDSPELLRYTGDNTIYPRSWVKDGFYNPADFGIQYDNTFNRTAFYLDTAVILTICNGQYPLPNIITLERNGVNFTFTPIPVYE